MEHRLPFENIISSTCLLSGLCHSARIWRNYQFFWQFFPQFLDLERNFTRRFWKSGIQHSPSYRSNEFHRSWPWRGLSQQAFMDQDSIFLHSRKVCLVQVTTQVSKVKSPFRKSGLFSASSVNIYPDVSSIPAHYEASIVEYSERDSRIFHTKISFIVTFSFRIEEFWSYLPLHQYTSCSLEKMFRSNFPMHWSQVVHAVEGILSSSKQFNRNTLSPEWFYLLILHFTSLQQQFISRGCNSVLSTSTSQWFVILSRISDQFSSLSVTIYPCHDIDTWPTSFVRG